MFDIGFTELLAIAVIGLFVIGPEKLPHTVRMGVAFMRKIKITLIDLQSEVEREVDKFERQVEIKELREQVRSHIDNTGITEIKDNLNELNKDLKEQSSLSEQKTSQTKTSQEKTTHTPPN